MDKFFFIVIIYFIGIHNCSFGQAWMRVYGGNTNTVYYRVNEHYDKGFVFTGYKWSGNSYYGNIFKVDINGDELWSKLYGKPGTLNTFNGYSKTSDGGMITCGQSNNITSSCVDPLIVKINACGEKEWCKIYNSGNCNSWAADITDVAGGGYITLISQWLNTSRPDVWLFRLDDFGNVIWAQQYVSNNNLFASPATTRLLATSDTNFVITGHAYSPDSLTPGWFINKFFLVKVDINGNTFFETTWGLNNGNLTEGNQTIENKKHILFTAGAMEESICIPVLFKTESNGTPFSFTYYPPAGIATTVNWLQDSSLVIGTDWQDENYDTTAIIKTDSSGNIIKTKVLITDHLIILKSSDVTSDNKLIVEGPSYNTTPMQVYAFKLNSDLEFDSIYNQQFTYDSLCPHPVVSDTTTMDDCVAVYVGINDPIKYPEKTRIRIYPIPGKSSITFEMPLYIVRMSNRNFLNSTTFYYQWNSTHLEIFDVFGKLIYSEEIPQKISNVKLDVSSWHEGMYVARVVFMNEVMATAKFVVKR